MYVQHAQMKEQIDDRLFNFFYRCENCLFSYFEILHSHIQRITISYDYHKFSSNKIIINQK